MGREFEPVEVVVGFSGAGGSTVLGDLLIFIPGTEYENVDEAGPAVGRDEADAEDFVG